MNVVIPSEALDRMVQGEARNLALPVQDKLREESRSANKGLARFLVACGSSE